MTLLVGSIFHVTRKIVSEMTYNVSMGTLNPTIPYYTIPSTPYHPFRKFVFDPTPKRRISSTVRPGSFVAPVKKYTMVKKVSEIFRNFREIRSKRFFFGAINFPLNGKKSYRFEKLCRIWEQEYYVPVAR